MKTRRLVLAFAVLAGAISIPTGPSAAALSREGRIIVDGDKLMLVSPKTGNATAVTGRRAADPQFSPDGTKILFARYGDGVWVMRSDGSRVRKLAGGRIGYFGWAPDGRNIVFHRYTDPKSFDEGAILRIGIGEDSRPKRLTSGRFIDQDPLWSPSGSHILFKRSHELRIMDADGANSHPLFERGEAIQYGASFSPEGISVVYSTIDYSVEPTRGRVEKVNIDGSGHEVLAEYSSPDRLSLRTEWSPDGTKIAFERYGSRITLHVMNSDGSGKKKLVSPRLLQDFAWSRDSSTLTYLWRDDGRSHVAVVEVDTEARRKLATSGNHWSSLDWH